MVLGATLSPDKHQQKQQQHEMATDETNREAHVPIKSHFFRPWKHEPRVRAASSLWRDAFLSAVPPQLSRRTLEPSFAPSAFSPIDHHSPFRSVTALSPSSSRRPWPLVAETVTRFDQLIVGASSTSVSPQRSGNRDTNQDSGDVYRLSAASIGSDCSPASHGPWSPADQSTGGVAANTIVRKRPSFPARSVDILKVWFAENITFPYLTNNDLERLSSASGLSKRQIQKWISNRRDRTHNTRPNNDNNNNIRNDPQRLLQDEEETDDNVSMNTDSSE